jgi:hypothetical protein
MTRDYRLITCLRYFVADKKAREAVEREKAQDGAMSEPRLCIATEFDEENVGSLTWDASHNSDCLSVSTDRLSVEWGPRKATYEGIYPPSWVPICSEAHLHSGTFCWDFIVEEMAKRQIGVGFMLQWDQGLDWGFFGYLGAGETAWAYDPSTGDVVTGTVSIAGGLPTFADMRSGVVSVRLELPRDGVGRGVFLVNGTEAPPIELPRGAVVVPAACLLEEGQRVRLGKLSRIPEEGRRRQASR